jgi:glutathione peroxidase
MTVYDFSALNIRKQAINLADYRGNVLLIVNTASKCGFTPQYRGLEALYQRYQAQGLVVLGFPCDQFAHQEPAVEAQIEQFCQINFGVTFPLMAKIKVNGRDAHPLYQYLRSQQGSQIKSGSIKWNFTKFLVDRNGLVAGRYSPNTEPADLAGKIEELLAALPAAEAAPDGEGSA